MDAATITQQVFAQRPDLAMCTLPPLPETGRCGIHLCGQLLADPDAAPRWTYTISGTDIPIEILLCSDHAEQVMPSAASR